MYPAAFDYYRATSVADAIRLLGAHADAKVLAGGHSLLPMMKLKLAAPPAIIDIGRIVELKGIRVQGNTISVGALTTHAEVATSADVRTHAPLLAEVATKIADPQVRNRGTVAGNLAHADPASDLPAVVLALDGTIHLVGPGGPRSVKAADFFMDLLTTDVQPGEIITRVEMTTQAKGAGSAYLKFEHPASGYAVCGAAALVALGADGVCSAARLCFNGVSVTPLDAKAAAAAVVGTTVDGPALERAAAAVDVEDPLSDMHFSGEYRASLARTYGRRALALAAGRARG